MAVKRTIPKGGTMKATTTKQFGDACEMLVVAKLTLNGMPTMKLPDTWPGYDLIAQPADRAPQRISVKGTRRQWDGAYIRYHLGEHDFDWVAVVMIDGDNSELIYIVPRAAFESAAGRSTATKDGRVQVYMPQHRFKSLFADYASNWRLEVEKKKPT